MASPNWDESKHPRSSRGSAVGGQWEAGAASDERVISETTQVLGDVGLKLGSWKDLPQVRGRTFNEPRYLDPTDTAMAVGFADALSQLKGTTFGDKPLPGGKLELKVFDEADATVTFVSMPDWPVPYASITQEGKVTFLVNTDYDMADRLEKSREQNRRKDLEDLRPLMSYAAYKAIEMLRGGKSIDEAVATEAMIMAFHEIALVVDVASGGVLTETWGYTPATHNKDWVETRISGYATLSPADAMAETYARWRMGDPVSGKEPIAFDLPSIASGKTDPGKMGMRAWENTMLKGVDPGELGPGHLEKLLQ